MRLRNGWKDDHGRIHYWTLEPSAGPTVSLFDHVRCYGPDAKGFTRVYFEAADAQRTVHVERVRLADVSAYALDRLIAPRAVLNGRTGLVCSSPAIPLTSGPETAVQTSMWRQTRIVSGDTFRIDGPGLHPGVNVSFGEEPMILPGLCVRRTTNGQEFEVELSAPADVASFVSLWNDEGGSVRDGVTVAAGTTETLVAPVTAAWVAVELVRGAQIVAAGVFEIRLPGRERERRADQGRVAIEVDDDAVAAAWIGPSGCGWTDGVTPAAVAGLNGARGHTFVMPAAPSTLGHAGWIVHRSPTEPHLALRGLAADIVRGTGGAVDRHTLVMARRSTGGVGPGAPDSPASFEHANAAPDEDATSDAFAAFAAAQATPANYPIAMGAVADVRGDEVRFTAAIRGALVDYHTVIVGRDRLPLGIATGLEAIAARLRQLLPTRAWRPGDVLDALRSPAGLDLAPADRTWMDGHLARFFTTVAEVFARFAIGSLRGPGVQRAIERYTASKAQVRGRIDALPQLVRDGHFWLRLSMDGWGAAPLRAEFAQGAIVAPDAGDRLERSLRDRSGTLGADAAVGISWHNLIVDAAPSDTPLVLRGLQSGRVPKSVVGVGRTLGSLGLDVTTADGTRPWYEPFGTSTLAVPRPRGGGRVSAPALYAIPGATPFVIDEDEAISPLTWAVIGVLLGSRDRPL